MTLAPVTVAEREALYARLPRVTTVLAEARLVETRWFTQEARDLGSALHAAIQLWLEGALDEESVDERIRPNLESFKRFWVREKPELLACERPVWDDLLGYVGTFDLLIRWRGRLLVIDVKRGSYATWHPIQLVAYALGLSRELKEPVRVANLYPTGQAKLHEHPPADVLRARHDWIAALRMYHRRHAAHA